MGPFTPQIIKWVPLARMHPYTTCIHTSEIHMHAALMDGGSHELWVTWADKIGLHACRCTHVAAPGHVHVHVHVAAHVWLHK